MAETSKEETTDIDTLNYLHDADVLKVELDENPDGRRVIRIHTICHPDAEYPPWDGRTVVVLLDDVVTARYFIAGYTDPRRDWISGWSSQVSQELKTDIERLENVGIRCVGIPFEVTFQSGSRLEGLCEAIRVSVGAKAMA
jgi:hypothetical protein